MQTNSVRGRSPRCGADVDRADGFHHVSECRLTLFKEKGVVVQMLTEWMDSITFSVIGQVSETYSVRGRSPRCGGADIDRADGFHHVSECRLTLFNKKRCGGADVDRVDGFHHILSHWSGKCRLTPFEEGVKRGGADVDRADGFHHVSQWVG